MYPIGDFCKDGILLQWIQQGDTFMKIIVIGATGTIGSKVVEALGSEHEIIKVGRTSGQYQVDIADPASVKSLFEKVGKFDALVNASGDVAFAPFKDISQDHWETSIRSKFLGQVNLVQIGQNYINDGGSFTLVTGVLSHEYIAMGTIATSIGRALEGYVQAAATVIGRGIRVNVVCPGLLEESKDAYGPFFPGHIPVAGTKVAQAYKKSVLGVETGLIIKVS